MSSMAPVSVRVTAQERDLLNSGQLTYERAWSMLAALDTPGMRRAATRPTAH